jgi:hypothetical protein
MRPDHRTAAVLALVIVVLLAGGTTTLLAPEAARAVDVTPSSSLVDLESVALDMPPVAELDATPDAVHLAGLRRPEPQAEPAVPVEPVPPATPVSSSADTFAQQFPAHAAATQVDGDPASFHWAVIIGVNAYQGRVGNTLGSVADALALRDILLARGWRADHVLVLTDAQADHDGTVRALEWLARSTDERSKVVVSSSGHIRHSGGRTGLWPSDNRYLWAADLGRMLGSIRAEKMWLSFQGCHAAGLSAPGVEGPGRVVTYSSPVTQKSFEDPETGHSLQGFYLFVEGIRDGWGDANGDGRVSVQEAHAFGAPRAQIRSAGQQSPVLVDGLGRPFHLEVGAP